MTTSFAKPPVRMNSWICLALVALVLNAGQACAADFKLAQIFSDGMVLQRGKPVAVFGTGNPHDPVTVKLGDQSKDGTVGDDGKWLVMLDPVPVGGPYTLTISSGNSNFTANNVMSGDVYLCSGQSNMQFSLKEASTAAQALATASQNTQLHLYSGSWKNSSPESARDFAAVGYFFGAALTRDPAMANVPIGLIHESLGGTAIEGWIPADALAGVGLTPALTSQSMFNVPASSLYQSRIAPVIPYSMSGVLWYQGEANAGHPEVYEHLLTTMISSWRAAANNPTLPFFIVQLPPLSGKWNGNYFTWLREAQAAVAAKVPNVDLVTTIDTTDGSNLHPTNKQPVGERIALLARRDIYKEKIVAEGPKFKSLDVDGNKLKVHFETGGEAMMGHNGEDITGFFIAGSDGVYKTGHAEVDGDTIVLQNDDVPEPKTVRYAWAGVPEANLVDADGLPAFPFRTDTLPIANIEWEKDPAPRSLSTSSYALTISGSGKVTSLAVGNNQFLANGLGENGGTSLPGGFGGRVDLSNIKVLGPTEISLSDGEAEMTISCNENDMTWDFHNKSKNPKEMSIALAPWVTVSNNGDETDLTSGDAKLAIKGTLESGGDASKGGVILKLNTSAPGESTLQFSVTK
jgi:sialate O-acetylesterase